MGLDMYLNRKVYIGANYDHRKITGNIDLYMDGKPIKVNFNKVTEITEEVCYWRKANQIHNWFVKNVQDGVDNCGEYEVTREQLEDLINDCKLVLADHSLAKELLPTQEGCFFGSTEYNDSYHEDLNKTIRELEPAIKEGGDFYYESSW